MYHYKTIKKQLFSTSFKQQNQHLRMISEGSSDTEDWSNDAENSAAQLKE